MADYTCPVCRSPHPASTEPCTCGAVAKSAGASVFALVLEDGADASAPLGLSLEECRRILTHMLNHGSIEKTTDEGEEEVGMFETLRANTYPLFEHIRRRDGMPPERHRLREYCLPETDSPDLVLELALTPMEYLLFRQLITTGRG